MNPARRPATIDAIPRLYALQREDDDGEPPTVVAWGLAFPDGSAVTLWSNPYPGAAVAVSGDVRTVRERYARFADADLVWLTDTVPTQPTFQQ